MKYLGIDYGGKNIGIAVSDDEGNLAFAKIVLDNDKKLLENILKICEEDRIEMIVIGESKNLNGEDNLIQKKILEFKRALEKSVKIPIHLEPEFLTSAEADRIQGENLRNIRKKDRIHAKVKLQKNDASAAALILNRFLEKQNND
ncbi:MAG: Holliday junction resolvase RuvX [Candidatus Pacebacteria bacterium]|nr:Holliday junction resolvase RuvX [Candidatus Paceibacterota bacterium]